MANTGKIGAFIFEDLDADGIQDPGELGIKNVTVKLLDRRNNILATTTSDANGIYEFSGLKSGSYRVVFNNPDNAVYEFSPQKVGTNSAIDSNGPTSDLFSLSSGKFNDTIDAGLFRKAKLGDFVFEDLNKNGIQDKGEPGIAGAKVNLQDSSGKILKTTQTDTQGFYEFTDLKPGNYRVKFIQPDGFKGVSPFRVGGNSAIDSDANPNNGLISEIVTLTSGQKNSSVDAGFFKETPIIPQNQPFPKFSSAGELEKYFVDDALKKYSDLFGKESFWGIPLYGTFTNVAESAISNTTNSSVVGTSGNFSETNTQEQGVDEADLVETDGKYIYQVTGQNLTIVDSRNPKKISIASQTDLKNLGNIQGAYLYQNKLTVISTVSPWQFWSNSFIDYNPISFNPTVNVSVFDVSNPTSVVLEEKSQLDGYLLSSRAVGDQVYVVTQAAFGLPQPKLIAQKTDSPVKLDSPSITTSTPTKITSNLASVVVSKDLLPITILPSGSQRYETEKEYLSRLEGRVLEEGLPNFNTVDAKGKVLRSGFLNTAENIYKPLEDKPIQLTSVSVFDVDDQQAGPKLSTGIPTSGAREIYTSLDNLYLLEPDVNNTDILKVNLNTLKLAAVGEAPGQILNQFSADEEKGFLRVATTKNFGNNSQNNVYVLQQEGQKLKTVGSVEGIAPGERIYSARFEGDYGFMVTFRQVDPFYTLDLSKPTDPKVAGELKLPGFSEYLQVIKNGNKTQVLGIGRDANKLKVSLFDVTDLKNPKEVDSFLFEGSYSSSQAGWDQQAVSYFPDSQTLAIPFYSDNKTGLRVFDVDPLTGLTSKGDILHKGGSIERSLRIGNDLYAISNQRVTVHDLDTLALKSEIVFPNSGSQNPLIPIDPFVPVGIFSSALTADVTPTTSFI